MTAASVSESRRWSSSAGSVPGRIVSTWSPWTSGVATAADAALTEVTPGTITASKRSVRRVCMCM